MICNWYTMAPRLLLAVVFLTFCSISQATNFVASQSGDWSSSATWNGTVPPTRLASDQIVIPLGVVVNSSETIVIDGVTSRLQVDGSLMLSDDDTLALYMGTLAGSGFITIGTFQSAFTALSTFSGHLTANTIINSALSFQLGAQTTVNSKLTLNNGILNLISGGSLMLGAGATIEVKGGSMSVGAGILNLQNSYNVQYLVAGGISGAELSGSGLKNVTVDIGNGNTLSLSSHLVNDGVLTITSGMLKLDGKDLVVNGRIVVSDAASIVGNPQSSISINSQVSASSTLRFDSNSNQINNLTINVGLSGRVTTKSDLIVNGTFALNNGIFDFSGHSLTIKGDFSGIGTLRGDAMSDLNISTLSGLHSALGFESGSQVLHQLTISAGSGNAVTLRSDLQIMGKLSLLDRSNLSIVGKRLILSGGISGNGLIVADSTSTLELRSAIDLSQSLMLSGSSIGSLIIAVGQNSTVNIGTDIRIHDSLNIVSGVLVLNSHALTINGVITCSVNGAISTNAASDITIQNNLNTQSIIRFDGLVNTLRSLNIKTGSQGSLSLSGVVDIQATSNFESGLLILDSAMLTVSGTLHIQPAFRFSARHGSRITLNASARVVGSITFDSSANMLSSLTLNGGSSDTTHFAGNFTISNTFSLSKGIVYLDSGNVYILGSFISSSNSYIATSASTNIYISANADILGTLQFVNSSNVIHDFVLDIGASHHLNISGNLECMGTMKLMSGILVMKQTRLVLSGTLVQTGDAFISSDASCDIAVASNTSLGGALRFSTDAHTLGMLSVKIADGSACNIASDLVIENSLKLDSTRLAIGANQLTLGLQAVIQGAGSKSYVILSDGGQLHCAYSNSTQTMLNFPVGTTLNYLPAKIDIRNASLSSYFAVGIQSGVRSLGLAGSLLSETQRVVNATWDVTTTSQTVVDVDLSVFWSASAEVNSFNRSSCYLSHYINSQWDVDAASSAQVEADAMFSMKRRNVHSFSPFAVFQSVGTDVEPGLVSSAFNVYPSPADDVLSFSNTSLEAGDIDVHIYSSTGQEVIQTRISAERNSIPLQSLSNGIYVLRIRTANYDNSVPLVVVHK